MNDSVRLIEGDCLAVLPTLPAGSVDAVVCDPPYPFVRRDYGYWDEAGWRGLIDPAVEGCRRLLAPTGSMVVILQPNSERVGSVRPWLWDFVAHWSRRWNLVQDVWWWNTAAIPEAHAVAGLLRPAVKMCVWLGPPDCHRDQDAVLMPVSERHARRIRQYASGVESGSHRLPSGHRVDYSRAGRKAAARDGTSPFNLIPCGPGDGRTSAGGHGHGAGTPAGVCRWWVRYVCPPGGLVLDPFAGSGTVGLVAGGEGRRAVLIEREPGYCRVIRDRLAARPGT